MTELAAPIPSIDKPESAGTLQRNVKRVKRTASLVGLVGVKQGVPMLAERIIDPNANSPRTVKIRELDHPFHLTSAHSDIAMLNEIVGMGVYDLPGLEDKIDGNLIIDLGANIGISAALFASRYPHSEVIAVEPHPRNVKLLDENAAPYGQRIIPLPRAIGLEPGQIGLANGDISAKGHHAVYEFRTGQNGGGIMAEVLTPEDLISLAEQETPVDGRVGLLKMNIEGEEKGLLNSRRMDPLLQRTNVAIIEAHDKKLGGTSDAVLAAASRTGLKQFDKRGSFHLFSR